MDLRLHRRQFVVARAPVAVDETWRSRDLPGGWVLSHQQDLELAAAGDPDRPDIVLGNRYCADGPDDRGAGRFVRLRWPLLTTDPAALLAAHVGRLDGALAVSSSPALAMLALTGEIPPHDVTEALDPRGAINYLPAPGTRWRAVRRLFADQAVDLAAGEVRHADHGIRPLASFEAARDLAADELVRFARELADRVPGTIFLPLTAGLDSRTLAAAFLAAGIRFETVTFRYAGKSPVDAQVAASISRRFGLRHQPIELEQPLRPELGVLLERQACAAALDWDNSHVLPGNGYRYQRPGDAMIAGNGFELGRHYFAHYFGDLDFARASGAEIWARRAGSPGPAALTGFLDDWRDWRGAHPDGMDWTNAFYFDQRMTAWRAALESGYDLLPAVVLNPANNARVYAALVTPEAPDQLAGRLQHALIDRLAPELARFPLNPPTFGERLRRIPRGIRRRLRAVAGAAR